MSWATYSLDVFQGSLSPLRQARLTPKRGGRNGLGFPALEKLTLDFSEWQLTDREGLLVTRESRNGMDSVGY